VPDWTLSVIPALRELLEEARRSRWLVLLASDHGHVPGTRLEYTASSTKNESARHRHLDDPDAPVADYEVAFTRDKAWGPPGTKGVVLLADEEHRYSKKPGAGEHGGATLAEVLAPTFLIGWEGVRDDFPDEELDILAPVPAWWALEPALGEVESSPGVTQSEAEVAPSRTVEPSRAAPAAEDEPDAEPTAPAAAEPVPRKRTPSAPPPAARTGKHPLLRSPMFVEATDSDRDRDRALRAVDLLHSRGGRANGKAFAGALRIRHASVNGLVARLQRVLNQDQAMVLRYDTKADQVVLDVVLLESVFEVDL